MKFYRAKIYWKDNPDCTLEKVFAYPETDEEIGKVYSGGLDIDDAIFHFLTEPDELEYLQQRDNGEDFRIVMRSPRPMTYREVFRWQQPE